jgi:hypothetical protein
MRILGNATVVNSTLSGNAAIGWHGGAVFQTDGATEMVNSTVAGNTSPGGTAAVFVGTFGTAGASVTLTNTVLDNVENCFAGYFGAGLVELVSAGSNVSSDGSCNLSATGDQPDTDPLLDPLADNGGPTLTHALQGDSPAVDAADSSVAPDVDQRGVARPQAAGDDVGSYELVP